MVETFLQIEETPKKKIPTEKLIASFGRMKEAHSFVWAPYSLHGPGKYDSGFSSLSLKPWCCLVKFELLKIQVYTWASIHKSLSHCMYIHFFEIRILNPSIKRINTPLHSEESEWILLVPGLHLCYVVSWDLQVLFTDHREWKPSNKLTIHH